LVVGCGSKGPEVKTLPATAQHLQVAAPWPDGAQIPRRYTCDGANAVPRITVGGVPKGTAQVALLMTDPDAPGGGFTHWTHWGKTEGRNSFGKVGYGGPCPPKGDKPHHYVITAYAVRRKLPLARGAEPAEVVEAIHANALASGSVTGTYGR
jgi:phosphatidylethanolamine-binding protein (PEBP) family uncharacterized protein